MVTMPIQSAQELLSHVLHDIEDAETQASKALKQLAPQLEDSELRTLMQQRIEQGGRVLKAVQQGLRALGAEGGGEPNKAARGIIADARELVEEAQSPQLKQSAAIAGVQYLEHYCIAAWGTVKALASEMGQQDLARAMDRALDEGKGLDRDLTRIAEGRVNRQAQGGDGKAQAPRDGGRKSTDHGAKGEERSFASSSGNESDSEDLKRREYRDEQGRVHHHTRSYEEQHTGR
jgi:ferritin-like metal-binding protein YciE